VGISLDPRQLVGVASDVAQFWLRTTIGAQQQLLNLLQNQADEPPPVRALLAAPETPASD
jgi:hypothetical protein